MNMAAPLLYLAFKTLQIEVEMRQGVVLDLACLVADIIELW